MKPAPRQPGRPPAAPGEVLDAVLHIRATAAQQAKLGMLGGGAWVRKMIDKAKPKAQIKP